MVNWAKDNHIKLRNIEDIKNNGDKWLEYCVQVGYSPWTVMTRRAALCKLCDVDYTYFKTDIPKRERAIIQRGRQFNVSKKYYNYNNNIKQITFCRCTGLRLSELKEIRGIDLFFSKEAVPFLHITKGTKGGKSRVAQIIGSEEEVDMVISMLNDAGEKKVFKTINQHINTHGLRAEYCQRIYKFYERELNLLGYNEIVYCRRDKKGIKYDKAALLIASKYMGHERYDVINGNYLY